MQPLSNQLILHIWETGQRQHPVDRALTILAATHSDVTWEMLARLSVGQRDDRLLAVYAQTFDSHLVGTANCSQCNESLEFALPIADMRLANKAERIGHTFPLEKDGYYLCFRLPDSFDLAAIATQPPAIATAERETASRLLLLQRCVEELTYQGNAISVSDLPDNITVDIATQMNALDPQADITLTIQCPACGHSMTVVLDILTFLWAKISAQARRILRDVHTLARAYGWQETDILAMSTVRRQVYLDMLGQ
ncbi:MAG: phage baseplate protein [Cyanobacteria bacterium P01_D01_bin.44]